MPVGFDELVDAVAAHRVDSAISALPVVPHRTREVASPRPTSRRASLLAAPPGTPITGTAGPGGRRVAVEWGSEGDAQARALQRGAAPRHDPGAAGIARPGRSRPWRRAQADAATGRRRQPGACSTGPAGALIAVGPPLRSDPYVVVVPARRARPAALRSTTTLADLAGRWHAGAVEAAVAGTD